MRIKNLISIVLVLFLVGAVSGAVIEIDTTEAWTSFAAGGLVDGDTLHILADGNLTVSTQSGLLNGTTLIVEEGGSFTINARMDMDSNGKIIMNGGELTINGDFKFPDSSGLQNVEIVLNGGVLFADNCEHRWERGTLITVGAGVFRVADTDASPFAHPADWIANGAVVPDTTAGYSGGAYIPDTVTSATTI